MTYQDFFNQLEHNNNREWFNARKDQYLGLRRQWINTMQQVFAQVAEFWPEVRYADAARNTFRIYRDIRFSNDKTPYKTHIGTVLTTPGLTSHSGFYIQAGGDSAGSGIYAGIWHPEKEQLRKLRRAIAYNDDEFAAIAEDPALIREYGETWDGESLKTAPKGYDVNHPMIKYLRLKDIGKYAEIPNNIVDSPDFVAVVVEKIRAALPLVQFLNYSLAEE